MSNIHFPEFKYYLRREITTNTYTYYFLNSSGVVSTQATPIELNFSPKGWNDKSLKWERGFEYWGVFTNMSNPLNFVKDGAKILRDIYYNHGVNGNCELYIERLNTTNLNTYDLYYRGEIDFTRFIDNTDWVGIQIMDGSYMENLKSREDTNYEIDLDAHADHFYINMDGITLKNKIEWLINPVYIDVPSNNSSIAMTKVFQESQIGNYNFLSPDTNTYASVTDLYNDFYSKHIQNTDQPMELSIEYDFYFTFYGKSGINYNASNFSIVIAETDNNGAIVGTNDVIFVQSPVTSILGISQHVTGTVTRSNFGTNNSLHLLTNLTTGFPHGISFSDGDYIIEAEFRLKETKVKALHPEKVFNELVDNISDSSVNKSATPLVTNRQMAVTCGDSLRELSGAKIKTSFKDFFDTFNIQSHLATYYDKQSNTHVITERNNVFDSSTVVYDVGEVSELEVVPLSELMISDIKVGNKDQDYSELNGRDEFNCEFEFTTPITRVKKVLDMITPYRTDMYGIEFIRANFSNKQTTDSDSDNDNFLIYIEDTPSGTYNGKDLYDIDRSLSATTTGVLFPDSAFNQFFSPKRILERNGYTLKSILDNLGTEEIVFQTASKNNEMVSGGSAIDEDANILISTLFPQLFKPTVFKFRCIQPVNIKSILDTNPFGVITFSWLGEDFEGFLLESSENPATKASQVIQLIASPNNDLTKLIK